LAQAGNISIDENLLIKRCRTGDSAAMEQLIIRYQDRIYNVILKMCGNSDDAAELTQEAFVKIIENIDKFRQGSKFYTWAFRIAVNLTLNHCKRSVKLGFKSLDARQQDGGDQSGWTLKDILANDNSTDPAVAAQKKELWNTLIRVIVKLDEDQRTVVVLRDIEGMSYAEIADVLGVELGTVKSRLSRARSNLRELLETVVQ